jgi:hypothetical protein
MGLRGVPGQIGRSSRSEKRMTVRMRARMMRIRAKVRIKIRVGIRTEYGTWGLNHGFLNRERALF